MKHEPPTACAKTDAVLARHLDGDLGDGFDDGYAFACGETLHTHLRECDPCQQALRRARRLDAALASAAGRDVAGHVARASSSWQALEARWWAAVSAAATGEPAAVREPTAEHEPARRRPLLPMPWLAAVAAAAAAFVCLPRVSDAPQAIELATIPEPPVPQPPAAQPPAGLPPCAPVEPAGGALAPMTLAPDAVQRWRRHVEAAVPEQAPTVAELAAEVAGAAGEPAARLAAAKALFAAARPGSPIARTAHRAAIEVLAGCGDRDSTSQRLHAALLDLARDTPHLGGQLVDRLAQLDAPATGLCRDDFAAVIAGTRLGTRELDAAVRRVARRHPGTAVAVAAALRCEPRADGGALLLLDLWHDLAVRGDADDDRTAQAWFAGQPAATFAAIAGELRGSRSAPQRQRCLLALGQASDPKSLAVLLEHTGSSHHAEAHAAAFAIAGLPRALLADVVPLAGDDGAFLLRAALARAGLPAAQPWVDALSLRPAELARVRGCPLNEFPEVASWFRERGASSDD